MVGIKWILISFSLPLYPISAPHPSILPFVSIEKVIAMHTGHFSNLVDDSECPEKDLKEHTNV